MGPTHYGEVSPAHVSLWLRLDTYVSLRDSGKRE
jgi:hypothetical protein